MSSIITPVRIAYTDSLVMLLCVYSYSSRCRKTLAFNKQQVRTHKYKQYLVWFYGFLSVACSSSDLTLTDRRLLPDCGCAEFRIAASVLIPKVLFEPCSVADSANAQVGKVRRYILSDGNAIRTTATGWEKGQHLRPRLFQKAAWGKKKHELGWAQ